MVVVFPGSRLGPYEVFARIGRGGMGEVYRARDTRLDRAVAIKVLNPAHAGDQEIRDRFEREARVVSQLSHPNICTLYDVGRDGNTDFLVMELLEGESLQERLVRGALPTSDLLKIAIQMADALDTAHRAGILHRDIKPANIFLTRGVYVKILDFGLAKKSMARAAGASEETTAVSIAGVPVGTPSYMSPEQIKGEALDARTDLFSFGVLLYQTATGTLPFRGNTGGAIYASILQDEIVPAIRLNPQIPPVLNEIIEKALEKDCDLRYQSAADMRADLQRLRRDLEAGKTPSNENSGTRTSTGRPVEAAPFLCRFTLTESVCRKLERSTLDPRIIGDHLEYLDNQVASDVLVLFVPGLGLDCHDFEPILNALPYRGMSQTLYGSEPERRTRISLGLSDHIVILREWIRDAVEHCRPKTVVLVAFALGADMTFEMLSSVSQSSMPNISGFLSLECNLSLDTCFISRLVASIDANRPETWIADLKRCGEAAASLDEWLTGYEYLVKMVRRFQANIGFLQKATADLIRPLEEEPGFTVFARRFKAARERVPLVRLVFSDASANRAALARLKLENLDTRVLGADFPDRDISVAPNSNHFVLTATEGSMHLINDFIAEARNHSSHSQ